MEEFSAFNITSTYTKGDIVTFDYRSFIFLPNNKQLQFSIGLLPDELDYGWKLWTRRNEDI